MRINGLPLLGENAREANPPLVMQTTIKTMLNGRMNLLMEPLSLNRNKYELYIYILLYLGEKNHQLKMDALEDKPFSVLI